MENLTEIQNDARREDNEMLIRRFVGKVGYDYIQHHKQKTAHIHPDFSEETKVFWEEIENRLQKPVTIGFDREKCLAELRAKAERQAELCEEAGLSSSYHYGLKEAYNNAIKIIEDCLEMTDN